jgi:hypothetical protein
VFLLHVVLTDKITVSADDTILVVKLKILEKLEIEPNEQVFSVLSLTPWQ